MAILTNLWLAFLAGLFAPLGAVCVLPLYPGFLAYLANKVSRGETYEEQEGQESQEIPKRKIILFGVLIVVGVILSMFIVGLLFAGIFQESLTNAIGIISPIAFGILAILSVLLIFNVDFSRFMPKANAPILQSPYWSALVFGLFFGAIVLPCNPASLAILFAVSTSVTSFVTNLLNFLLFGFGMGLPLLILAFLSASAGKRVVNWLADHKKGINVTAGIIMLGISLYYLIFVFKIFG